MCFTRICRSLKYKTMAVFVRRCYCSKKLQIALIIGLFGIMPVVYYLILQLQPITIKDLDFTKQLAFRKPFVAKVDVDKPWIKVRFNVSKNTAKAVSPPDINKRDSVASYIDRTIEEALKEDKGTGCDIPFLDPFAKEVMQFDKTSPKIECTRKDWVKCYFSICSIEPKLLEAVGENIRCQYRDILYQSDLKHVLGPPTILKGKKVYALNASDHVEIKCSITSGEAKSFTTDKSWVGHGIGYRPITPETPPRGREKTLNVLIFGFDSTAKNGFIRKMPKSYKYITEKLGATVLNAYNIVGDGTPAALFPILTGKTELELPECRKTIKGSGHLDDMPFIFYKLKKDGYRTAYYEDMPWIGTFQYRFNGFRHQPADHYLRDFYLEESKISRKEKGVGWYCVGGTPRYQLMMNITDQFLKLDGKRFAFTFVADITHDDFNLISNADEPFVQFLDGLSRDGRLKDTLLVVMGDHGPRYANVRNTLQGKLEERLPFMAIRLPEELPDRRKAEAILKTNADTLTTPHDIYATVLDVIDMEQHWNSYKVKGADLTRGLTLLKPIPKSRSCGEAGVEPHWCSCLKWEVLQPDHEMYRRVAQALVDQINQITEFQRALCVPRTLVSIEWVTKKLANKKMLEFKGAKDHDGYVGQFGSAMTLDKQLYQVKITVAPNNGAYEGAVTHLIKENKLYVNTREISRTNAYNTEPACISEKYPHLNKFCYCNSQ